MQLVKELTCGRIFNKLLFQVAAVVYIEHTSWPINVNFGELLYTTPEAIRSTYGTLEQRLNLHSSVKFRPEQFILSPVTG